jgi:hypothetical protein
MVHVTDRADIAMRLGAREFRLGHLRCLRLSQFTSGSG